MKKLFAICLVVCLVLSLTYVSSAAPIPPSGAPDWWNTQCFFYAYAQWNTPITPGMINVSPLPGETFWYSNFLSNTDFKASIVGTTVTIDLKNGEREDLYKEIFILIQGTSSIAQPMVANETFDTGGQTFKGSKGFFSDENYFWSYIVNGEIHHQPEFVKLSFSVPGLTSITGLWAGENCIPEPATVAILGLGALLLRRKK